MAIKKENRAKLIPLVAFGTVTWPKDIDFDPDTLYLEGRPAKHEEQAA